MMQKKQNIFIKILTNFLNHKHSFSVIFYLQLNFNFLTFFMNYLLNVAVVSKLTIHNNLNSQGTVCNTLEIGTPIENKSD